MIPGAYQFLRDGDGAAQARHLYDRVHRLGGPDGRLIQLDCESDGYGPEMTAWASEWRQLTGGHPFLVYSGAWWWRSTRSPSTPRRRAAAPARTSAPACSTLESVVRRHFPNAVMGADLPPQTMAGVGIRTQCTATARLDQADYPPLPISLELGRVGPGTDGRSAEEIVLAETPRQVAGYCPASMPPTVDGRFPHMWTCEGPENEITPVAGAVENGNYVIVFLVGFAATTPAIHDTMAETTTQLTQDVLTKLTQMR